MPGNLGGHRAIRRGQVGGDRGWIDADNPFANADHRNLAVADESPRGPLADVQEARGLGHRQQRAERGDHDGEP